MSVNEIRPFNSASSCSLTSCYYYYYTNIMCVDTESEALAVTRWAAW